MNRYITFLAACAALMNCSGDDGTGCRSNADCSNTAEYCNHHTGKCEIIKDCNQVHECVNLCCSDPCATGSSCADNCGSGYKCNYSDCHCEVCQSECTGKNCGDDGCGGSCGSCNAGQHCDSGACVVVVGELGDPCPNGDSDCPAEWPICLTGGEVTYCSKICVAYADCGDPSCCLDIVGGKFCFDSTQCPGNGDLGDPCPFDTTVNSYADSCAVDLTCLGLMADGSNGTCTTDADCSSLGEAINPDCVGGYCGASFCAEECPGGVAADCPAGTIGQDISGACYCIPIR